MFSDEAAGEDIEGVLVQCGNDLDTNYYWLWQDDGPSKMYVMPVICVGSLDTPGFAVADAELTDDGYVFPDWDAEIRSQCIDACFDAHDPTTEQMPVCGAVSFSPNQAWGNWHPDDGPNCDSTVPPRVAELPPLELEGPHSEDRP